MTLRVDDVLVVVDIQYDFLPGGSLAVAGGNEIIEPINALAERFRNVDSRNLLRARKVSNCPRDAKDPVKAPRRQAHGSRRIGQRSRYEGGHTGVSNPSGASSAASATTRLPSRHPSAARRSI